MEGVGGKKEGNNNDNNKSLDAEGRPITTNINNRSKHKHKI